jgi:UTP--glucose-1-phosphate uridylyltransferase
MRVRAHKAVIPAAGLGTRFLPATKAQPKEMLPVVDKPAIQYVVEEAVMAGLDDVLLVTGRGKRALEDHFDHAAELERQLAAAGQADLLAAVQAVSRLAPVHYVRQGCPSASGTRWAARGSTWAASPSPCSSGTTSSARTSGCSAA